MTIAKNVCNRSIKVHNDGQKKKFSYRFALTQFFSFIMGASLFANATHAQAQDNVQEAQRDLYKQAIEALKNKDVNAFQQKKAQLRNYPLYPYLAFEKWKLEVNQKSLSQAIAFEKQYANLPFANSVRSSFLTQLARNNRWQDFVTYQTTTPSTQSHQCNYYYAHSQAGDKASALTGARELYLSGSSVDAACDKLFAELKRSGQLSDNLITERMVLAFKNGNSSLLAYLRRQLSENEGASGQLVVDLFQQPAIRLPAFVQSLSSQTGTKKVLNKQFVEAAFQRVARQDSALAVKSFDTIVKSGQFTQAEQQVMAEFLASRVMATSDPQLARWRDQWLARSTSEPLLERRFRVALTANNWKEMATWLDRIPTKDSNLKWRYWQARIASQQGNEAKAKSIYQQMLGERHFYSVAAAIQLGAPIQIPEDSVKFVSSMVTPFASGIARVKELIALDLIPEARQEWNAVLKNANREETEMLAVYAARQNWYALAVQATISGKLWGHLEQRFPVAHRWWFDFYSQENQLPVTTLLALSRQESAFYTHAVSPVGARGLMQLMPKTAQETSAKIDAKYLGVESLSDPGVNIRLGSSYLRMLLDRFDQNRILAFAAYNAGPSRVNQWLEKSSGNLDAFAFIEAIPFNETRGYVQNVLMYDIYYRKLMDMPIDFLAKQEIAYNY